MLLVPILAPRWSLRLHRRRWSCRSGASQIETEIGKNWDRCEASVLTSTISVSIKTRASFCHLRLPNFSSQVEDLPFGYPGRYKGGFFFCTFEDGFLGVEVKMGVPSHNSLVQWFGRTYWYQCGRWKSHQFPRHFYSHKAFHVVCTIWLWHGSSFGQPWDSSLEV